MTKTEAEFAVITCEPTIIEGGSEVSVAAGVGVITTVLPLTTTVLVNEARETEVSVKIETGISETSVVVLLDTLSEVEIVLTVCEPLVKTWTELEGPKEEAVETEDKVKREEVTESEDDVGRGEEAGSEEERGEVEAGREE